MPSTKWMLNKCWLLNLINIFNNKTKNVWFHYMDANTDAQQEVACPKTQLGFKLVSLTSSVELGNTSLTGNCEHISLIIITTILLPNLYDWKFPIPDCKLAEHEEPSKFWDKLLKHSPGSKISGELGASFIAVILSFSKRKGKSQGLGRILKLKPISSHQMTNLILQTSFKKKMVTSTLWNHLDLCLLLELA